MNQIWENYSTIVNIVEYTFVDRGGYINNYHIILSRSGQLIISDEHYSLCFDLMVGRIRLICDDKLILDAYSKDVYTNNYDDIISDMCTIVSTPIYISYSLNWKK